MSVHTGGFTFGLPPSLGRAPVRELAREFADVLFGAGFATVIPYSSYQALEQGLLDGEVDAAWGPPIVCAQIERNAGTVVLRAIRDGAASYRSVLICRQHDPLEVESMGREGARRPRAVWVDERSMGGFLLPRRYLHNLGIDPTVAFSEQRILGSYDDCFAEVLDGKADITASYTGRHGAGYVELCGKSAYLLRIIAFTEECPNDGVVLAPQLSANRREAIENGLRQVVTTPASHKILCAMLDVDGFDRPPAGSYAPLVGLLNQGSGS